MNAFIIVLSVVLIGGTAFCFFGLKFVLSYLEGPDEDDEDVPSMNQLKINLRRMAGQKSLYGVWLQLVEEHWDNIRDSQGDSDCTFRHKRKIHDPFDKEYVNGEVRSLALDYWKRNRFHMREAFVNWCYFMSRKAEQYEILKSASGTDSIPCFKDPYSNSSNYDVDVDWIDCHMPIYMHKRKAEWLLDHNLT